MYTSDSKILKDIELVAKSFNTFYQCKFREAFQILGKKLWPKYAERLSVDYLETDSTRFYLTYGYACLLISKALLSLTVDDLDVAEHFLEQAKSSAYQSTAGWWRGSRATFQNYSLVELHAQLVYVECDFYSHIIAFVRSTIEPHISDEERRGSSEVPAVKLFLPGNASQFMKFVRSTTTISTFFVPEYLFSISETSRNVGKSRAKKMYSTIKRFIGYWSFTASVELLLKIVKADDVVLTSQSEENLFKEFKAGVKAFAGSIALLSAILPSPILSQIGLYKSEDSHDTITIAYKFFKESSKSPNARRLPTINFVLFFNLVFDSSCGPRCRISSEVCVKKLKQLKETLKEDSLLLQFYSAKHSFIVENNYKSSLTKLEKLSLCMDLEKDYRYLLLYPRYEVMWGSVYQCDWLTATESAAVMAMCTEIGQIHFMFLYSLFSLCAHFGTTEEPEVAAAAEKAREKQIFQLLDNIERQGKRSNVTDLPIENLAKRRANVLIHDSKKCFLFVIEELFWHDEFRSICGHESSREKYSKLINQELRFLEILHSEDFDCKDSVLILLLGTAFTAALSEYQSHSTIIEKCFGMVVYHFSQYKEDKDTRVLSTYLVMKICYQVLKNAMSACNLYSDSDTTYYDAAGNPEFFHFVIADYLRESRGRNSKGSVTTATEFHIAESLELLKQNLERFLVSKDLLESKSVFEGRVQNFASCLVCEIENDLRQVGKD